MKKICLGLTLSLLFSVHCQALVFFLDDSALLSLSATELTDLKRFAGKVLDQAEDNEKAVWHSEESNIKALVKPMVTYQLSGQLCRRTAVAVKQGEQRKNLFRMDFCQTDGQWQYRPTPLVEMNKQDKQAFLAKVEFVLDNGVLKMPNTWHNKQQSLVATFVVVEESATCRELAVSLQSQQGAEMSGLYHFCREQQKWRYQGLVN